jgi:acyl dehydratase
MTARPEAARVVELAEVPALGGLYRRGVTGSVRAAASRRTSVRGDDLPPTQVLVRGVRADPDHLAAYQRLLHEVGTDLLPAGFVHVLAFPVATALMVRPDFPLPLLGMVHVANSVEHRRAIPLGEALDVQVHARDLRAHGAGVTVDVVAEASVAGETVWQGVSTYLAKGVRLAGGREEDGAGAAAERAPFEPPTPTGQWRLSRDVGTEYASVSGDRNPIHTSRLAAKAFGFPRTIAHGMYTAARALADVGPARGEAYRWDVKFAKPVLLPTTVAVRVAPEGEPVGDDRATTDSAPGGASRRRFTYAAWNPRKGSPYLTGSVTPLD